MTREDAVNYLLKNNIFTVSSERTPAMEFYIKNLIESTDSIYDIDCYAHLNILFGYDIGFNNAMRIDCWLYNPDINEMNLELCTLEITYKDKELIEKCCFQCGIDVSFDKWRTTDFDVYEYFN